ncbi:Rgg family transcriptional regulator [Lactobacillus sp. PSON]|uniref:Rgg family transcriptional regulator n=1 Tax=Lactobacillus sp. PSON TaxID=3455454 RepID=UPI004041B868
MDIYGNTYKKLRKKHGLTLSQASSRIVDAATLSRWENGKGDMYFGNVIELLKKINMYPDEFIIIAKKSNNEKDAIFEKLKKLYLEKDSVGLYELAQTQLKNYNNTTEELDLFLVATICCMYKDLTNKSILSNKLKAELYSIFDNVQSWNEYYSRAFGNVVEVIDNERIFQYMKSIVIAIDEISNVDIKRKNCMIIALLNAYTKLIKKNIVLAKKAKILLENLEIPRYLMYAKVKLSFLNDLLNYQLGDNFAIQEMEKVTSLLGEVGYSEYANELALLFKDVAQKKRSPK